jgi:predicted GNAT family acetyltransferase
MRGVSTPPRPYRVVDNPAELRYEIHVDDELAGYIRYRIEPGTVVLAHTDVEPRWEGGWVGRTLVREALDDLRARGLYAAPLCPFIIDYVRKNSEFAPLIVADPAVSD